MSLSAIIRFKVIMPAEKKCKDLNFGNMYFFMTGQNTKGISAHPTPPPHLTVETSLDLQGAWLNALWKSSGCD